MISRRTALKLAPALLVLSLAAPSVQAAEPLRVVATFSILGDMVQNVGGTHIQLTTLVGPDGDAHVYQPTPQAAAAISGADVVIMNGLEFEGWLARLNQAAAFDGALAVVTAGVRPIAFEEDEPHHDDDDHDDHAKHDDDDHDKHDDSDDHDGHDHGTYDPHAWQSVENAVIYVDNITAALAKADPANASAYYTNRAAYVAELKALDAEVRAIVAALPKERRTVVTSHDAFGYFAADYGLTFRAPQGLSTESEASAADVAALIEQIREQGITAVFVESIADNRLLQQIARETGAAIGGTLYSDALSGPEGPAATYLDMMRHNARILAQALGS